jgi:hypothetical protein
MDTLNERYVKQEIDVEESGNDLSMLTTKKNYISSQQ